MKNLFKKQFTVGQQSLMRGSDKKKLKEKIRLCYAPAVTMDQLDELISNKKDLGVVKLQGSQPPITLYCQGGDPLFFEYQGQLYPSIYALSKIPDMLIRITIYPPVFNYLSNGADLMFAGIHNPGDVPAEGKIVSIALRGSRSPVAVGFVLPYTENDRATLQGKVVSLIHYINDSLWQYGTKEMEMIIEQPITNEQEGGEDTRGADADTEVATTTTTSTTTTTTNNTINEAMNNVSIEDHDDEDDQDQDDNDDDDDNENDNQDDDDENDEDDDDEESDTERTNKKKTKKGRKEKTPAKEAATGPSATKEEMDKIVFDSFMGAIKFGVKDGELPLPLKTFFNKYMLYYAPANTFEINLAKSSYKKVLKLIEAMKKKGLVDFNEPTKGNIMVTRIGRGHSEYKEFQMGQVVGEQKKLDDDNAEDSESTYGSNEAATIGIKLIRDCFQLPKPLKVYFTGKMELLPYYQIKEINDMLVAYVRQAQLDDPAQPSSMRLDGLTAELVKAQIGVSMPKNQFYQVFRASLLPRFMEIQRDDGETVYSLFKQIEVHAKQVANKKVIEVKNLEHFFISTKELAKDGMKVFASSITVTLSKENKVVVRIQGNQTDRVVEYLQQRYNVPEAYISVLNTLPKSKQAKSAKPVAPQPSASKQAGGKTSGNPKNSKK
ncbi:hypothetical protein SAMD00019534_113970 [Acytostelium subglobosum LB1]|uniref:hypothetical protein n=1 Tax=Acytostelium subglobosum LB1 TaxID=1410327 RepID=UPI000644B019|nr:hypothetical protein SAMD00019534_113970 [Acytostelium subglobosum LB1]GAM28221.1 hypothetical protein SAMD00019534_113970 [Acytostelium subglobosum LB1]|eukprot:XP_012748855.1 hypothetical protein SAMD00019534_113970 [Acytostelium subglobosum LB1]